MNRRTGLACLLALAAPIVHVTAQQTVVSDERTAAVARADHAIDELLARPTTLNVTNVSLSRAIDAAATSAKVLVQYRTQVVNAYDIPITLHLTNVPLRVALDRILAGTTLQVIPDGPTRLTIVESRAVLHASSVVGTVTGLVTDAATKRPLAGAAVSIDSARPVKTRENGTFTIAGIAAGPHKLTVRLIGYRAYSTLVTVRDDASIPVTVALTPSATTLSDVVTTATGDQRRFEVGNAVGTIKADSIVPTTMIRNMSDLLQARVPGVIVENTDGAVGAPSKIRLRGVNSIELNNDPIIILDGVRLNAQSTVANLQTNVGSATMLGQLSNPTYANRTPPLAPSRLDDIDPNTIESIDVLRGPSASSLYGTDAANGVIVIKTKKGHAGSLRANISGDAGNSSVPGTMPEMWWGWGHYNAGLVSAQCNLTIGGFSTMSGGGCQQDSVTQFNPQNDPAMRTLGTGTNRSLFADISGGNESMQQYLSGKVGSNVGTAKMSDAESRLLDRLWSAPVPSWMKRPNTQQEVDGTSRTTYTASPQLSFGLGVSGVYNNVLNSGSGSAFVQSMEGTSPADTLTYLPSESQRTKVTSLEKRGILSLNADYRPFHWLALSGTSGGDYGQRVDDADLSAQNCSLSLILASGEGTICPSGHTTSRGETFVTSAAANGRLTFDPFSWLNLQTSVGEQYSHTNFYSLQVGNSDPYNCPLQFGTSLLTPGPVCTDFSQQAYNVTEARDEAATAGVYVEERITVFGVYSTFGVREDVASAFGGQVTKNSPPAYPKLNFSYPISDKSFFPKQSYVSSLRLRFAYGQSGNQASQLAVLNNYSLNPVVFGGTSGSQNSVVVSQLGNSGLRPEKGTEWEGGIDVSFLENERIHAEVTMYRKYTRDALATLTLAPSYGADNLSQYFNLGNVQNRGIEVTLNLHVIDSRPFTWDLNILGSANSNKLVHKAPELNANGPLNTQFREGYPLYGYWGVPVASYADVNGDGILQQSEIKFGPLQFMGAPYPKSNLTYNTTAGFWNGAIRVAATFDQINGQTNPLLVGQGTGNVFPRAAVDRTAPLAQQAGYIQAVVNNAYMLESSTLRLNELSVTYTVPASTTARLFRAQSLAVTLAGRNVALWSSYAGKDPNTDTSGLFGDASQDNSLGTPQPRIWTLRFNLGL